MENERICRQIPRTREECTGERTREVCTDRPSRQVCTTNRNGRTVCTTVGGGRDCRTVSGNQICRTVTYMDNDCNNVQRRRCEIVPGRLDCRQVSYDYPICRMETQYRTENYACTRTETVEKREEKLLKNDIDVQINTNGLVEEFQLSISAKEHSRLFNEFSIDVQLEKQPKFM